MQCAAQEVHVYVCTKASPSRRNLGIGKPQGCTLNAGILRCKLWVMPVRRSAKPVVWHTFLGSSCPWLKAQVPMFCPKAWSSTLSLLAWLL